MDADCLIKLTKANLKEIVCTCFHVALPETVKREVVDNAEGHMDAAPIDANIRKGLLLVDDRQAGALKGEESVAFLYQTGDFDAVCSDDKKFIKKLKLLDIPYITPAVFIVMLLRDGNLTIAEAETKLEALAPFISNDEYITVQVSIQNWRMS